MDGPKKMCCIAFQRHVARRLKSENVYYKVLLELFTVYFKPRAKSTRHMSKQPMSADLYFVVFPIVGTAQPLKIL